MEDCAEGFALVSRVKQAGVRANEFFGGIASEFRRGRVGADQQIRVDVEGEQCIVSIAPGQFKEIGILKGN
jgi:hypothetical protein